MCPSRFIPAQGMTRSRTPSLLLAEPWPPCPKSGGSCLDLFPLPASTTTSLTPHSFPPPSWGNLPSPHSVPWLTKATSDLALGVGKHKYVPGVEGEKEPAGDTTNDDDDDA